MDIALKQGTGFSAVEVKLLRAHLMLCRQVDPVSGCWLWTGAKTQDGHGTIWLEGELFFVHRLMYELDKGKIPVGKLILHTCPGADQPACFNPGHLRAGTHAENANDREQRKSQGASQ